jgi:hypothetical protein
MKTSLETSSTLIQCSGRCQQSKAPGLFRSKDMRAWLRFQASGTGPKILLVCRQCLIDRRNKTGHYRVGPVIARAKAKPNGWAFRMQAASLCPGSATAVDLYLSQRGEVA